jgi:hypothetical protein
MILHVIKGPGHQRQVIEERNVKLKETLVVVADDNNNSATSDNDTRSDSRALVTQSTGSSLVLATPIFKSALEGIISAKNEWAEAHIPEQNAAIMLLARIYEAIPLVDEQNRHDLIREVRKHPDVGQSNRWDPYDRERLVEELFLAMILGLKNHRSRKSQWKTALLTAAEAEVPRDAEAFIAWINGQGGIEGVQPGTKPRESRETQLRKAIAELRDRPLIGMPLQRSLPVTPLRGGIGVAVFKQIEEVDDGSLDWVQIDYFCSNDLVMALHASMEKAHSEDQQEAVNDLDRDERSWIKVLRDAYKEWLKSPAAKSKGTPSNFEEWVNENQDDYADQKPDSIASVLYENLKRVMQAKTRKPRRKTTG